MTHCNSLLIAFNSRRSAIALAAGLLLAVLAPARAQQVATPDGLDPVSTMAAKRPAVMPGTVVVPESSLLKAADKGQRFHTNINFVVPAMSSPNEILPPGGWAYETPASLACLYQLVTPVAGCDPNSTTAVPTGGAQTIAIVDAFDDPSIAGDLAYFSDQFGLPFNPSKFQVVYATGVQPPIDPTGGWELEEALDVEYAHAMAPNATIYLVEAASNKMMDLMLAIGVANNLVTCGKRTCTIAGTGKGEINMSWGAQEWMGQMEFDMNLHMPGVVYVASTGDVAGVSYPGTSPWVVSVGGTTTSRSMVNGKLIQEIAWSSTGGGLSAYESIPSYQSSVPSVAAIAGKWRATPDVSLDGDPNTGVWVYNSFPYDGYYYSSNWWIVGGTSVSSAVWTGIINAAAAKSGAWAASSAAELTKIYGGLGGANFNDITYGTCGYYASNWATKGYDLCTGVGTPRGLAGK